MTPCGCSDPDTTRLPLLRPWCSPRAPLLPGPWAGAGAVPCQPQRVLAVVRRCLWLPQLARGRWLCPVGLLCVTAAPSLWKLLGQCNQTDLQQRSH